MKLVKIAKSVLDRLTWKKHRRRNRVATPRRKYGRNYQTNAERLIHSNYGLTFKNPPPERAGEKRAAKRLAEHRKQWVKSPVYEVVTRQQRRAAERKALKNHD